jgi:hypothetical protein
VLTQPSWGNSGNIIRIDKTMPTESLKDSSESLIQFSVGISTESAPQRLPQVSAESPRG